MTGTNHVLMGATIAGAVSNPAIALPLAFVSHFFLDALPHFGFKEGGYANALKQPLTKYIVFIDIVGLIILSYIFRGSGVLVYITGVIAISPDFHSLYRYFVLHKLCGHPADEKDAFIHFHSRIQKFERPVGIFVEIIFFAVMLYVFANV